MQRFLIIWFGQLISTTGSGLTSFALGIWIYQNTGSTALFAIVPTLIYLPGILISPFAGIIVDRLQFRTCMILSDFGSGLVIVLLAVFLLYENLQVWQVYIAVSVSSLFSAFQWTAYSTAATQLVPPVNLTQANALVEMAKAIAKIFAPLIAGLILTVTSLQSIIFINICTFLFSLFTLLIIPASIIPAKITKVVADGSNNKTRLSNEITRGFNYITEDPGLLRLMIFSGFIFFTLGLLEVLFTPLVLSIGSANELGKILSIGGCGWLVGSLIATIWKGPVKRINGVFLFSLLQGLWLLLGGLKPSIFNVGIGIFGYLLVYPFIASCIQTIWQTKVPLNMQGRVFSTRLMFEWLALPLGYLLAGLLADIVFEPLLMPNGCLANSIGKIIGIGHGRGVALLIITTGFFIICITALAYMNNALRQVESND